jgi:hypothetical protein
MLVPASFFVGKKRSGIFYLNSSPKQLSHFILSIEIKVGYWQIAPALKTNQFFVPGQTISTG